MRDSDNAQSQELMESFLPLAQHCVKHRQDRERIAKLLARWVSQWSGPHRVLDATRSHLGAYLHFNQMIGTTWVQAFTFHATQREGFFLKGPDTDRARKSHKLRRNKLETTGLDALFEAWSAHPESRPAGIAVEFHLDETPDDIWEACLQEALGCLREKK